MKIRREAKIGIFGVLMLALTFWGFNFLKGKDLFNKTHTYYAKYEQVGDIQVSAPVLFKGVKIGVVTKIEMKDLREQVILEFNVRSKYDLPEDSKAKIVSASLLGGKAIEIELGESNRIMQDRDTLRSEIDRGLLDMAGSEIELIKQKATIVVDEIVRTLNNVNLLLSEENLRNVNSMLSNVSALTGNANRIVAQDLTALVQNLNDFTEILAETAPNIDTALGNFAAISDSLRQADVHMIAVQANELLGQLNSTMAALNDTEGTAGKLIHDPELYNNLVDASNNLSKLLEDVKARPGRYVHFSVFGRRDR